MPIVIQDGLPAAEVLNKENISVMTTSQAVKQDIRPLKLIILNLMPLKIVTENQILRMLSNTPLQVEIDLIQPSTHTSKHTSAEHLDIFYKTFADVSDKKYDGMIITGAPVENMDFEDVDYWPEMEQIMKWSVKNVTSTLHICWGAQAGLYYHYGVPKHAVSEKVSGVYCHNVYNNNIPLIRGFEDSFLAPHSRYTEVRRDDIEKVKELEVISDSEEAGIYIVIDNKGKHIFVTGHSEYDPLTLKEEYERDLAKGLNPIIPINYFPDNDPKKIPKNVWRSHAHLLFANWLNHYVYQMTPYELSEIR